MTSFSVYTQNNNCNLILRNSIIFSLYQKNINKKIYFKSNNSIKGHYIDSILNDSIYFATNGLKKTISFRKNEINFNHKKVNNNFVSFFLNLEDDLEIFNIYPIKYNTQLIKSYLKQQELISNWKVKNSNKKILTTFFNKNIDNIVTDKPVHLSSKNSIFIKNYFDKYYFINDAGFIQEANGKVVQRNLFSGLLYIFPKNIQDTLKLLFSINYLILNFFSSLQLTEKNIKLIKVNLILYTIFLKYLNFKIAKYFKNSKISIRKSNWFLFKYIKSYSKSITSLINFFFSVNIKKIYINKITALNLKKLFYFDTNLIKSNFNSSLESLSTGNKIKLVKLLEYYIILKTNKNLRFLMLSNNLVYKYLIIKSLTINYLLTFSLKSLLIKPNLNFINFYDLLTQQIRYNTLNIYKTNLNIQDNLVLNWSSSNLKQENDFYINRSFLKFNKIKLVVQYNKIWRRIRQNYYSSFFSYLKLRSLKKTVFKIKRFLLRKQKNKKNNNKIIFTTLFKKRDLKLRNLKYPWLKLYNLKQIKK